MNTSAKAPLTQLFRLTSALRDLDKDMAVNTVHILFIIARNPGISSQDIMKQAEMTQPSTSRHLAILSGMTNLRKQGGYDFIDLVEDVNDRRNKVAFLTSEGKAFLSKLTAIIAPGEEEEIKNLPTSKDYLKGARNGRR